MSRLHLGKGQGKQTTPTRRSVGQWQTTQNLCGPHARVKKTPELSKSSAENRKGPSDVLKKHDHEQTKILPVKKHQSLVDETVTSGHQTYHPNHHFRKIDTPPRHAKKDLQCYERDIERYIVEQPMPALMTGTR